MFEQPQNNIYQKIRGHHTSFYPSPMLFVALLLLIFIQRTTRQKIFLHLIAPGFLLLDIGKTYIFLIVYVKLN